MVKFGLRLDQNKSIDYPPEAYVDYDKLKEIIHVLAKKKLAGWVFFLPLFPEDSIHCLFVTDEGVQFPCLSELMCYFL